jgi:hypothetical protein
VQIGPVSPSRTYRTSSTVIPNLQLAFDPEGVKRLRTIIVSVLLKLLADGKTAEDLLDLYPELEREDVGQAIQYAAWVVSDRLLVVPAA